MTKDEFISKLITEYNLSLETGAWIDRWMQHFIDEATEQANVIRSALVELQDRLSGQRKFIAEHYTKEAANGALIQIEETERFIKEKLGTKV